MWHSLPWGKSTVTLVPKSLASWFLGGGNHSSLDALLQAQCLAKSWYKQMFVESKVTEPELKDTE